MIRSGLPIDDALPRIVAALRYPGHAVLTAPPGSGKTTIVPLALLEEDWVLGRILVLEPRRLATRAAARRMAALLGEDVGMTVGFTTRDERRVSPATRVEVVTEGVLTRRLQRDPSLEGTAVVIFDEVHERNLQTDLGLALALDVRGSLRPDLRLLAMSATVQADRFAVLLGGDGGPSPRIDALGEPFSVDVRYVPMATPAGKPTRRGGDRDRLDTAVVATIVRALRSDEGDVLVFLPGAGEINRAGELLTTALAGLEPMGLAGVAGLAGAVDVRPLYGMLSAADQDAALFPSPTGRRRVVLATDIAESSLTVEGVRIVVDAGLARVPRFDVRTGMTRLRTVSASRSSADQRAGRAGRQGPGVAYRLWSKLEHGTRRQHLEAEITQVDLCGLALELASWGPDAATQLAWLDPPPARALAEGRALLQLLGALDADGRVTDNGRRIASLPLHPRLARMVVEAGTSTAAAIAALLEDRDVLRGRPDEVPTDLGLRLSLLEDSGRRHPSADGRALGGARSRWRDIARRASISVSSGDDLDIGGAGRDLALAYPDRLAVRRGQPGNFQLRSGTAAWVPKGDPLGDERFIVVADLDGDRGGARVRIGASLSTDDVLDRFADQIEHRRTLTWDRGRDELVEKVEERLGGLVLSERAGRPVPGEETVAALLERVRQDKLRTLAWTDAATALRARVGFVHRAHGDPWPDWSDAALLAGLDAWLAPSLAGMTSWAEVRSLDLVTVLRAGLDPRVGYRLDEMAPTHVTVASGRHVELDYTDDGPVLAVPPQDLYGTKVHPSAGGVPLIVQLLSPAGRPVQITRDLPGFWAGSWAEVRKDMAGRYPKHTWPTDPANAQPPRRPR